MNAEKLARMQAQVRIGGKGTARRKKKTVHKTDTTDEKKLQAALQKIRVNQIPGIEEVNLFKDDGSVMHFKNPKIQASLPSNTFALHGQYEDKQLTELLPGIINQMGPESISRLGKLAGIMDGANPVDDKAIDNSDDDVPDLVENFEEASKDEVVSSIDKEQIKGESELAETQEKDGIEHSTENNDVLALDLDNLTLEESDKEAPQVNEKEIMDEVNNMVTSKFEKTEETDSSSSEDCDNTGPAYSRIKQLTDEEDDSSNEQKLKSEHADKDDTTSDNDAENS